MRQQMKNKQTNWVFKFWFHYGSKLEYLQEFGMYLGMKGNTEYQLGKLLFYRFMKVRATPIVMDIMLIY